MSISRPTRPELVLHLNYEKPISANDLGRLLRALADDYKKLSGGRTLIVGQIKSGSIIAILGDAAAWLSPHLENASKVAAAAKSVKKLYTTIAELLSKAQNTTNKEPLIAKGNAGTRSVQQLLETAIHSGGEVDLEYKSGDGEELRFRFTSAEAAAIREQNEIRRAGLHPQGNELPSRVPRSTPDSFVTQLEQIADGDLDGDAELEAQRLVHALINTLVSLNMRDMIEPISEVLVQRGRWDLAHRVATEAIKLGALSKLNNRLLLDRH
ncbi:hypothetical protein [Phyllobacterium chamaecytisi]|uniref:hypothetical protein n=1 Tax=Phyllobacterium chamaecytisi TaxID=2876082 RepID=UPI001CC9D032|nr:hypothetical protein [Phyllobacterium sp. KW56]MBZ9602610.1 hypothetical protein [Phyllobacterium sp. KW56]